MEDRFEVELVNDSTEFDAISAATAECGSNDKCWPLMDYADGCTKTDDCQIDYT
jgi:hypothetical protein